MYRIKYMVALVEEKDENYLDLIQEEKKKLVNNAKETYASDSKLLKISQKIMTLPIPLVCAYLKLLRLLHVGKQFIKKKQWKKATSGID